METGWRKFGWLVLGTVLTWVVTSVGGWLTGHWSTVGKAFAGVAHAVWTWVTYPVPVPAILLAALVVLAASYVWAKFTAARSGRKNSASKQQPLSNIEHQVLAGFAVADGRSLLVEDIANALGVSLLEAQNALNKLVDRQLLDWASSWGGKLVYNLTQAGTAHVVAGGYIPPRHGRTAPPNTDAG